MLLKGAVQEHQLYWGQGVGLSPLSLPHVSEEEFVDCRVEWFSENNQVSQAVKMNKMKLQPLKEI